MGFGRQERVGGAKEISKSVEVTGGDQIASRNMDDGAANRCQTPGGGRPESCPVKNKSPLRSVVWRPANRIWEGGLAGVLGKGGNWRPPTGSKSLML